MPIRPENRARKTLCLAPARPGLAALMRQAAAAYQAMTPEQRATVRRAQVVSWVCGDLGIDGPGPTKEQVEESLVRSGCIPPRASDNAARAGGRKLSNIYIDVQVYGGAHVREAITDMVRLAERTGICVWASLNGVRTLARPDDSSDGIFKAWQAAVSANRSYCSTQRQEPPDAG